MKLSLLFSSLAGILVLSTTACSGGSGTDDGPQGTTGDDAAGTSSEALSVLGTNEHTAFDYFVGKGLSRVQAAAIVGNLMQESNVNPTIHQVGGGPGRGIAQWSVGDRWNHAARDNVQWFANQQGQSINSLELQLAFVWYELETFAHYGLDRLQSATNLSTATVAFQNHYEVCGKCNSSQRISKAQQVLNAFGKGSKPAPGKPQPQPQPTPEPQDLGCYSSTLNDEMPPNACVQSAFDGAWYQCKDGSWVDRWSDPTSCDGEHPLR